MQEKIDVLCPLGTGSQHDNIELRYNLRSLEKNFKNLGKVFIVGYKPKWAKNIVHVPCEDLYNDNKDANLFTKIYQGCKREDLSENFLRISDDQLLLKEMNCIDDFKIIHNNEITRHPLDQKKKYAQRMKNTRDILIKNGFKKVYNFDTHLVQKYNKISFISILQKYDASFRIPPGFCVNTLYFNEYINMFPEEEKNMEYIGENSKKIEFNHRRKMHVSQFEREIENKTYVGYNDNGITTIMGFLNKILPDKSSFEI